MLKILSLLLFTLSIHAAVIPEKVLICGICKNIEKSFSNTKRSATNLGKQFIDYRIILYENNSQDTTKHLLRSWSQTDPHVLITTESLDLNNLIKTFEMKVYDRIEAIARARNKVLDVAMQDLYSDYKYVIWADLDFLEPWDINHLVETILYPEQEWDAVLANGAYDLFAFRDEQFPIGFELLGDRYWHVIDEIRSSFSLDPKQGWRKVYSAFGGLGIYKREAIKGCRYSAVVTKDVENAVLSWLEKPSCNNQTPLMNHYLYLLSTAPVVKLETPLFYNRSAFPYETGVQLYNTHGDGKVTWFSCTSKNTLPLTCEHIAFHAAMAARGHDKIFINPQPISNHPP